MKLILGNMLSTPAVQDSGKPVGAIIPETRLLELRPGFLCIAACVALLGLLSLPTVAVAQRTSRSVSFSVKVPAAEANLKGADIELAAAKKAVGEITYNLRKDFEIGDNFRSAQSEQRQALAERDVARAAVLFALAYRSDFQAAEGENKKAKDEVARLKADHAGMQQILDAANRSMNAGNVVSKLTGEALNADARYVQANKRMLTVTSRMDKLRREFEKSINSNPEMQAAKQALAKAEANAKTAQKELEMARTHDNTILGQARNMLNGY